MQLLNIIKHLKIIFDENLKLKYIKEEKINVFDYISYKEYGEIISG